MERRPVRPLVLAVLAAGCTSTAAGCASVPQEARDHARLLALYADRVKREAEDYTRARDRIAQARLRNLTSLEEVALRAEQSQSAQLDVWSLTGATMRSRLYRGVLAISDTTERQHAELAGLRRENAEAIRSLRSRVGIRRDALSATSKELAALAAGRDLKDQVGFYFTFFRSVGERLEAASDSIAARAAEIAGETPAETPEPDAGEGGGDAGAGGEGEDRDQ